MLLHRLTRRASLLLACMALLIAAPRTQGATFFFENFDDPAGSPLVGEAGGYGFTGTWKGKGIPSIIAEPGLSYPGISAAGNAAALGAPANSLYRMLDATYDTTGNVEWLAFLIRQDLAVPNDGGAFGGVTLSPASGKGESLFVGAGFQDNRKNWGMNTAGAKTSSCSKVAVEPGQITLLVVRIKHQEGNDLIDLFVNPALTEEPTKPDATKKFLDLAIGKITIENRASTWTVDEIRFGDTFYEAIGTTSPAQATPASPGKTTSTPAIPATPVSPLAAPMIKDSNSAILAAVCCVLIAGLIGAFIYLQRKKPA